LFGGGFKEMVDLVEHMVLAKGSEELGINVFGVGDHSDVD